MRFPIRSLATLIVLAAACGGGVDGVRTADPPVVELPLPQLPATLAGYSDARVPLPQHFLISTAGTVVGIDNTPASNPVTDAGATLGRVLFYDVRLSANNTVSCASCHQQRFGFSDTARVSRGFQGGHTARHAMGLANARFYQGGRFFWDERAASLEAQVLAPIQDRTEMGMELGALGAKLQATSYYPALFQAAFGTPEVTSDRTARALAQFVRSMVSSDSRFDSAFAGGTTLVPSRLSAAEQQGLQLFSAAGCVRCHRTNAVITDRTRNNGLDAVLTDTGAGNGLFKAPSLRNVAVRAPYMHDGRFRTLDEVVEFYDSGVRYNPSLDLRLQAGPGAAARLGLSAAERGAIVAYLRSLTDSAFLTAPRFADPFVHR
ncbi:MAG: hypothetical protein JWO05_939 [Gemmatimonadetes bacterium]|nr:hypothetical protein [Gemmatimonadota bacterium]